MGYNPPTSAIPSGFRWLTTITPPKYGLSILVSQIFSKCENGNHGMGCPTLKNVPTVILKQLGKSNVTVKEFTEFMFSMKYDDAFNYTMIVLCFTIAFLLLTLLSMRCANHEKR
ncbi:hypothetical protein Ae201684P_011773 [Aphanomyces euteiches]|uniref:Uncharacterized protein n=1 Tax=Aphanomyces euteiches TaxID=100861 RepID=A0A6G0WUA7_9STRA|nr:hypothetical protein Ae201684_011630 [Aphanomyces euteiches]KAH9097044.1 hypothetical protein Ae201684P_011773 [Aphanomyces euteiches]KAH9141663.1 hypothetical protein AeRB84_014181 [Aphanomyces euteiches]